MAFPGNYIKSKVLRGLPKVRTPQNH